MRKYFYLPIFLLIFNVTSLSAAEVWMVSLEPGQNGYSGGKPNTANGNTGDINALGTNTRANSDAGAAQSMYGEDPVCVYSHQALHAWVW